VFTLTFQDDHIVQQSLHSDEGYSYSNVHLIELENALMDGINDGRFLIAAIGVDVYLTSDGNTNPEAK
jgi:hypothetical protein